MQSIAAIQTAVHPPHGSQLKPISRNIHSELCPLISASHHCYYHIALE